MEVPTTRIRLNSVIEVIDRTEKGFITVEDIEDWASEHFNDKEQIQQIIRCLDPEGNGKVGYEDFQERLKSLIEGYNGNVSVSDQINSLETFQLQRQNEETKNTAPMNTNGVTIIKVPDAYSSTNDNIGNATETDIHQYETPEIRHQTANDIRLPNLNSLTTEEGFMGVGEGDSTTIDYDSDKELATSRFVRTPSGRKVASKLLARSKNGSTSNLISRKSSTDSQTSGDDLEYVHRLNEQINYLTSQLEKTEDQCASYSDTLKRLRLENTELVKRYIYAEEQLSDCKISHAKELAEENKKLKATVTQIEGERDKQIEVLNVQIRELKLKNRKHAQEISSLRGNFDAAKSEASSLLDKNDELEVRLAQSEGTIKELTEELKEMQSCIDEDQQVFKQVLQESQEELTTVKKHYEDAKLEIERLNLESKNFAPVDTTGYQLQIETLQRDIAKLKDINDKMQKKYLDGQLRAISLDEEIPVGSLAAELELASQEELVTALKNQEDTNQRMRIYLDSLLAVVMEKDPSLLEITKLLHHQRIREELDE